MRNICRPLIALFFIVSAPYSPADESKFKATTTSAAPLRDSSQNNPSQSQLPDCTRLNTDPRCPQKTPPSYRPGEHPDRYPDRYSNHSRPVIINQLPPQPAIEINTLSDDWEGCRKAKLGAIRARNAGHADEANNLDEWLWKNCRSYSNELRQLEQDDM